MSLFDNNLPLKIVAWLLYYPFCIWSLILKFFVNKETNTWDAIQAPQNPRTIVITGASQGLSYDRRSLLFNIRIVHLQALVKVWWNIIIRIVLPVKPLS